MQVNIGIENGLDGVVDLVTMQAIYFDGATGDVVRRADVPDNLKDLCAEKKMELIATLAEIDEEMEEYYMNENSDVPVDILKACIRKHTIALKFCPVFLGSAFKNKGVQPLLDGVIDYLPNPKEVVNYAYDPKKSEEEKVVMEISNKKPFVGLAFKLEETQYGQLTWIRIY